MDVPVRGRLRPARRRGLTCPDPVTAPARPPRPPVPVPQPNTGQAAEQGQRQESHARKPSRSFIRRPEQHDRHQNFGGGLRLRDHQRHASADGAAVAASIRQSLSDLFAMPLAGTFRIRRAAQQVYLRFSYTLKRNSTRLRYDSTSWSPRLCAVRGTPGSAWTGPVMSTSPMAHDVVLALDARLARGARGGDGARGDQIVVGDHLGLDEAPLDVAVDDTRRLRRPSRQP